MASSTPPADVRQAVRRLLVLMTMSDGAIEPAEVRLLQRIYRKTTGAEIDESDLLDEISEVQQHGTGLDGYLVSLAPVLGDRGRHEILRAAILLAGSDGAITARERKVLGVVARGLEVGEDELQALVDSTLRSLRHGA
jgi:tellurite resistance protein